MKKTLSLLLAFFALFDRTLALATTAPNCKTLPKDKQAFCHCMINNKALTHERNKLSQEAKAMPYMAFQEKKFALMRRTIKRCGQHAPSIRREYLVARDTEISELILLGLERISPLKKTLKTYYEKHQRLPKWQKKISLEKNNKKLPVVLNQLRWDNGALVLDYKKSTFFSAETGHTIVIKPSFSKKKSAIRFKVDRYLTTVNMKYLPTSLKDFACPKVLCKNDIIKPSAFNKTKNQANRKAQDAAIKLSHCQQQAIRHGEVEIIRDDNKLEVRLQSQKQSQLNRLALCLTTLNISSKPIVITPVTKLSAENQRHKAYKQFLLMKKLIKSYRFGLIRWQLIEWPGQNPPFKLALAFHF